ncbi:ATP-NAD kinase family protein [Pseudomonas sp. RIT-PI-AD]|uniref:ATP-NAD kinase family protein n=1 Tax=Pseudomonas sp. RIT-PI-AD TaxID=3035294 RepID=UPI0021D91D10|nr:ATP-NAD kinase family protein [Pseudomonas sp. RIT-PI-AD]
MGFTLGLVINPFAGLGGAVGLKGSDGAEVVARARRLGAHGNAPARALRALQRLAGSQMEVITATGELGEQVCREAGIEARVIGPPHPQGSARDTQDACAAFLEEGVDLLLFAGGDGTARDVAQALAGAPQPPPILGIPCGVKMYSGVFALSPEHAGELALRYASGRIDTQEAELLDIDESASRADRVSTRLHGYARVPADRQHLQSAKASGANPDRAAEAVAAAFAETLRGDHLYILGPGRTIQALAERLNGQATLLGVDAYLGRELVCRDASETELLALAARHPTHVVVSVTGGQGCLFGRGNQQIGPRLLANLPADRLHVLASSAKIAALPQGRLFVDSGDPQLDARLSGFIRVHTAPGRSAMVRVVH